MPKKIESNQFASIRMWRWSELQTIIDLLSRKNRKSLRDEQIKKFPELYRSTCADLAQARMRSLTPDLIEYLNNLVGQAHQFIYSRAPLKRRQVGYFFKKWLPGILFRTWPFVLLSVLLFTISSVASGIYIYNNPEAIGRVVPETVVLLMTESYSESITEGRSLGMSGMMTSYYIQHNSTIAFYSFAAGVLGGLGTLYFLIYNGIFLGAIAGYISRLGYSANFFTFVTAHSVPELTGLVLAAAAGFYLGYVLIKSTRKKRLNELKIHLGDILGLVVVSSILLLIAAFTEGMISGSTLPVWFRISVAVLLAALLIFYFVFIPVRQRRKHRRDADE